MSTQQEKECITRGYGIAFMTSATFLLCWSVYLGHLANTRKGDTSGHVIGACLAIILAVIFCFCGMVNLNKDTSQNPSTSNTLTLGVYNSAAEGGEASDIDPNTSAEEDSLLTGTSHQNYGAFSKGFHQD